MAGKWERNNNRKQSGQYFGLPHAVMASPNYIRLSSHAVKLLNDLGFQYNGKNNGDLCATWSMMIQRGWKSASTLYKAINELTHYGFIFKSRQGGRHKPTLYSLTWQSIDECKGKLDIKPTNAPQGLWREEKPDYRH
tara:strand:- start:1735 stop:2145 length:411 start_codon:yes stop_codon:yes gene_type:complete